MRLFVAITMPEDSADALGAIQAAIPVGRPVPPENLHLTLAFLGEVPDREAEAVHDALDSVKGPPVRVEIAGIEALGAPEPHVVAAMVGADPALRALHARLRAALHGAGVMPPRERFRPHVTLARLPRRLSPDEASRLAAFLAARGGARLPPFTARAFTLFRSTLRPEGSLHEALADYPLG